VPEDGTQRRRDAETRVSARFARPHSHGVLRTAHIVARGSKHKDTKKKKKKKEDERKNQTLILSPSFSLPRPTALFLSLAFVPLCLCVSNLRQSNEPVCGDASGNRTEHVCLARDASDNRPERVCASR
jgi:hypothetical protein